MPRWNPTFTILELANEIWKAVVGYETYYSISNLGRVRRDKAGRGARAGIILKAWISTGRWNYPRVNLVKDGRQRTWLVHQLVASAFHGPCPDGLQVDHSDSNPENPRADNLAYKTPQQNIQHSIDIGTFPRGENHYLRRRPELILRGESKRNARLTAETVRRARSLRHQGWSQYAVAKELGVHRSAIAALDQGKTWTHID